VLRRVPAADLKGLRRAWGEAASPDPAVARTVSEILLDVQRRGDRALIEWTARLDRARLTPARLRVTESEIDAACRAVPEALLAALREAALRIERFAFATVPRGFEMGHGTGIVTGVRVDPLASAGLYVPGGKASYPSTVLMSALPARVAGVPRRAMVTPPGPRGEVAPLVLAAARECGVHEIYRLGGAQAVAALAFGTRAVRAVDVITGPGNAYVAEAKRQVMGRVRIDSIAGPSELVVLADGTADADTVALRLMAQAEHDEVTRVALVTWAPDLAAAVDRALRRRLPRAGRRAILAASLPQGLAVSASGPAAAVRAVNELAPEHLELHVRQPRAMLEKIRGAGAVFLGSGTPTPLGDYGAGPNHTLPTGRTARFASALSAADFVRHTSIVEVEAAAAAPPEFFAAAAALARAEGLPAHAESLESASRRNKP
jgi:histidinol dehydrogenase